MGLQIPNVQTIVIVGEPNFKNSTCMHMGLPCFTLLEGSQSACGHLASKSHVILFLFLLVPFL